MNLNKSISVIAILLFSVLTASGQYRVKGNLVWSEEFNYKGLPDDNIWNYEVGYVRGNEAQYYTYKELKNARVEKGCLVIEARKERKDTMDYTSASINTLGKVDFFLGRIEIRAKLPKGRGIWPAIWMMGSVYPEINWPDCGEIDIMEYVGYFPNTIYSTVHTPGFEIQRKLDPNNGPTYIHAQTELPEPFADFHIYAMEWTSESLDFFIDEKLTYSYRKSDMPDNYWKFDKPQFLLINLAVGGAWGGVHGIDDSIFPARYYIDWVRYYK